MSSIAAVHGRVDPAFAEVADEFRRGFELRGEVGASVCVRHAGKVVVDLWGGVADTASGVAWKEDTIGIVFSCTKAATALCAHLLVARGELGLDRRIAHYWPAFATAGKADMTLRMVLDHTAGLPAWRQPLKSDGLEDGAYLAERLQSEPPFWTPGERHGYHAVTFGVLIAELVRRTTGRSLGTVFRQQIAEPHRLDFHIGLPEANEPRVAPIILADGGDAAATPFSAALADSGSIPHLMVFNAGDWARRGLNTRAGRAAEIPSANGVTNARGLSALYELLQPEGMGELGAAVRCLRREAAHRRPALDASLLIRTRFSNGFMLGVDNGTAADDGNSLRIGEQAFGHCGSGGSVGFVDPACALSFGYTMNRMGRGMLVNRRGQALIDAAYRAVSRLDAEARSTVDDV